MAGKVNIRTNVDPKTFGFQVTCERDGERDTDVQPSCQQNDTSYQCDVTCDDQKFTLDYDTSEKLDAETGQVLLRSPRHLSSGSAKDIIMPSDARISLVGSVDFQNGTLPAGVPHDDVVGQISGRDVKYCNKVRVLDLEGLPEDVRRELEQQDKCEEWGTLTLHGDEKLPEHPEGSVPGEGEVIPGTEHSDPIYKRHVPEAEKYTPMSLGIQVELGFVPLRPLLPDASLDLPEYSLRLFVFRELRLGAGGRWDFVSQREIDGERHEGQALGFVINLSLPLVEYTGTSNNFSLDVGTNLFLGTGPGGEHFRPASSGFLGFRWGFGKGGNNEVSTSVGYGTNGVESSVGYTRRFDGNDVVVRTKTAIAFDEAERTLERGKVLLKDFTDHTNPELLPKEKEAERVEQDIKIQALNDFREKFKEFDGAVTEAERRLSALKGKKGITTYAELQADPDYGICLNELAKIGGTIFQSASSRPNIFFKAVGPTAYGILYDTTLDMKRKASEAITLAAAEKKVTEIEGKVSKLEAAYSNGKDGLFEQSGVIETDENQRMLLKGFWDAIDGIKRQLVIIRGKEGQAGQLKLATDSLNTDQFETNMTNMTNLSRSITTLEELLRKCEAAKQSATEAVTAAVQTAQQAAPAAAPAPATETREESVVQDVEPPSTIEKKPDDKPPVETKSGVAAPAAPAPAPAATAAPRQLSPEDQAMLADPQGTEERAKVTFESAVKGYFDSRELGEYRTDKFEILERVYNFTSHALELVDKLDVKDVFDKRMQEYRTLVTFDDDLTALDKKVFVDGKSPEDGELEVFDKMASGADQSTLSLEDKRPILEHIRKIQIRLLEGVYYSWYASSLDKLLNKGQIFDEKGFEDEVEKVGRWTNKRLSALMGKGVSEDDVDYLTENIDLHNEAIKQVNKFINRYKTSVSEIGRGKIEVVSGKEGLVQEMRDSINFIIEVIPDCKGLEAYRSKIEEYNQKLKSAEAWLASRPTKKPAATEEKPAPTAAAASVTSAPAPIPAAPAPALAPAAPASAAPIAPASVAPAAPAVLPVTSTSAAPAAAPAVPASAAPVAPASVAPEAGKKAEALEALRVEAAALEERHGKKLASLQRDREMEKARAKEIERIELDRQAMIEGAEVDFYKKFALLISQIFDKGIVSDEVLSSLSPIAREAESKLRGLTDSIGRETIDDRIREIGRHESVIESLGRFIRNYNDSIEEVDGRVTKVKEEGKGATIEFMRKDLDYIFQEIDSCRDGGKYKTGLVEYDAKLKAAEEYLAKNPVVSAKPAAVEKPVSTAEKPAPTAAAVPATSVPAPVSSALAAPAPALAPAAPASVAPAAPAAVPPAAPAVPVEPAILPVPEASEEQIELDIKSPPLTGAKAEVAPAVEPLVATVKPLPAGALAGLDAAAGELSMGQRPDVGPIASATLPRPEKPVVAPAPAVRPAEDSVARPETIEKPPEKPAYENLYDLAVEADVAFDKIIFDVSKLVEGNDYYKQIKLVRALLSKLPGARDRAVEAFETLGRLKKENLQTLGISLLELSQKIASFNQLAAQSLTELDRAEKRYRAETAIPAFYDMYDEMLEKLLGGEGWQPYDKHKFLSQGDFGKIFVEVGLLLGKEGPDYDKLDDHFNLLVSINSTMILAKERERRIKEGLDIKGMNISVLIGREDIKGIAKRLQKVSSDMKSDKPIFKYRGFKGNEAYQDMIGKLATVMYNVSLELRKKDE